MRDDFGLPSHFHDAAWLAQRTLGPFGALEHLRAFEQSTAWILAERMETQAAAREAMLGKLALLDRFEAFSEQMKLERLLGVEQSVRRQAWETTSLARTLALPVGLEAFRPPADLMAERLAGVGQFAWATQPAYLDAFNHAAALSEMVDQSLRVDADLRAATFAFAATAIPDFETLAGYRGFLDGAGLGLPHWPKMRLLSAAEQRRRFKATLQNNAPPAHVKRAKSLVHCYEVTLREILDGVMADTYGEDWAQARLPLCGCKGLLGKWRARGGQVLDHADYADYARIMGHPEHFAAVFEAGFDDPAALVELVNRAGRLRAASHHARAFTPEDLRDLRLTWRTLETGLLALTPAYELDDW